MSWFRFTKRSFFIFLQKAWISFLFTPCHAFPIISHLEIFPHFRCSYWINREAFVFYNLLKNAAFFFLHFQLIFHFFRFLLKQNSFQFIIFFVKIYVSISEVLNDKRRNSREFWIALNHKHTIWKNSKSKKVFLSNNNHAASGSEYILAS